MNVKSAVHVILRVRQTLQGDRPVTDRRLRTPPFYAIAILARQAKTAGQAMSSSENEP